MKNTANKYKFFLLVKHIVLINYSDRKIKWLCLFNIFLKISNCVVKKWIPICSEFFRYTGRLLGYKVQVTSSSNNPSMSPLYNSVTCVGCGISKMVRPKNQAFCPRINMLKGNFDTNYFELLMILGSWSIKSWLSCFSM